MEEGRAVCPGEGLTYNCTIFDNASLVPSTFWSANGLDLKADRAQQKTDTCGPFTVQFAEEYGDCYIFTLIVNASLEVNGTVIQCRHNGTSVGTTTVLVTGTSYFTTNERLNFFLHYYVRSSSPTSHGCECC